MWARGESSFMDWNFEPITAHDKHAQKKEKVESSPELPVTAMAVAPATVGASNFEVPPRALASPVSVSPNGARFGLV
jgi:hypothetical protein